MKAEIEAVRNMFGMTNYSFQLALTNLSRDDLVYRLRDGKGSSIIWNLGHIAFYRVQLAKMLGTEIEDTYGELFGRTAATDGSNYPATDDFVAYWKRVSEELDAAFHLYLQQAAEATAPDPQFMNKLTFYAWHEAYHMGTVGHTRVELGHVSISELVMAAMEKNEQ